MKLTDSVETIKGVGAALARQFKQVGVVSVQDLLLYYPRRYNDFSHLSPIAKIRPGEATVKGVFKQVTGRYVRGGLHITEAILSDDTSSVRIVWFNQPYRARAIKNNEPYFVSGVLDLRRGRLAIANPSCELVSSFPVNTARIIPVYRQTKHLKSPSIRKALRQVFTDLLDYDSALPLEVERQHKLLTRREALHQIHFPEAMTTIAVARRRLGFEEVFELILANLLLKQEIGHENALPIPLDEKVAKKFVYNLPFRLTDAQRHVIWQIYQDISGGFNNSTHGTPKRQFCRPMNRLIQGDVGSGKTVIAVMAALMVAIQGYQTAFMAPTELLARQHARTLTELLKPLKQHFGIVLLVGSMSTSQKTAAHKSIATGKATIIVGTHALLQEKVDMHKLALVIVDEQHRFGVEQRRKLTKKTAQDPRQAHTPHVLTMTATPIPRSLALTVYGELNISSIREKPAKRKDIITKLVKHSYAPEMYQHINEELNAGRQAFVVCPLIEPSEMLDVLSAQEVYKKLTAGPFAGRKIELLHGKLKADDKQDIMQNFLNKKTDVLVSTTVVEVGVDVPNATVMLVMSPERFGLAQIHQLRGRVGRGEHQGYCYLLLDSDSQPSQRLRALERSADGFKLAELDLQLRGPGAIYGQQQHGALDLRMVDITDTTLIKQARTAALHYANAPQNLLQYPQLQERVSALQRVIRLN